MPPGAAQIILDSSSLKQAEVTKLPAIFSLQTSRKVSEAYKLTTPSRFAVAIHFPLGDTLTASIRRPEWQSDFASLVFRFQTLASPPLSPVTMRFSSARKSTVYWQSRSGSSIFAIAVPVLTSQTRICPRSATAAIRRPSLENLTAQTAGKSLRKRFFKPQGL